MAMAKSECFFLPPDGFLVIDLLKNLRAEFGEEAADQSGERAKIAKKELSAKKGQGSILSTAASCRTRFAFAG